MATPVPDDLRALAHDLRALAAAIDRDLDGLPAKGGPETWLGPAADSYRWAARTMTEVGRSASRETRGLARAIEARAAQHEALLDAARTEAGEARREAEADHG